MEDHHDLIVHNRTCSLSEIQPGDILQDGRELIRQATSPSGWFNVAPTFDTSVFSLSFVFSLSQFYVLFTRTLASRGNAFVFTGRVPNVDVQYNESPQLQEWGIPVNAADGPHLDIKQLEAFESFLCRSSDRASKAVSPPSPSEVPSKQARQIPHDDPGIGTNKRRRIELEMGSLYNVIPLVLLTSASSICISMMTNMISPITFHLLLRPSHFHPMSTSPPTLKHNQVPLRRILSLPWNSS
jgi:hypothetical protein